jgi:hypothetical protein
MIHLFSESQSLYDWRFTATHFVSAASPLRLTASNFIFQLNTCGYSPYVTSFLTIGYVCRLQLLLGHVSAVMLRPESRGTHDHILPRFEIPPTWRTRSPYLYSPGTGWPGYTHRNWVPFSSFPTTRRATVEVIYRLGYEPQV